MSKASLFQLYLDNFFEFPDDIKNDMVYCQRAFQAHIKVHQMVIDVFLEQEDADPQQKQRILNELENEMYEINAEQNYIQMHLRKIIKDFNKMLKENSIPVNQNLTNAFISNQLVGLINDTNVVVKPMRVQRRATEAKLIEKYFEIQEPKNVYEVLDSDEEIEAKSAASGLISLSPIPESMIDLTNSNNSYATTIPTYTTNNNNYDSSTNTTTNNSPKNIFQESLLKPMAQRYTAMSNNTIDPSSYLEMRLHESQSRMPADKSPPAVTPPTLVQDSTNVQMSRMNLRQALKKVEKENMAKAAARKMARCNTFVEPAMPANHTLITHRGGAIVQRRKSVSVARQRNSPPSVTATQNVPVVPVKLITEPTRPVGRPPGSTKVALNKLADAAKATAASKSPDSSDSSSNSERQTTPPQNGLPLEPKDTRELPSDYDQVSFLHMFELFTHDMKTMWQQRRSKRRRRCVQSNERADFHYGRIEYASNVPPPPAEKKKKSRDFLLSPQLKAKRVKRAIAEDKESLPSRSSSSSPDDKIGCNECLKGGGILDPCCMCKGFYHQTCHREVDDVKSANKLSDDKKICPACIRLTKKNRVSEDVPKKAMQSLQDKFGKERGKRRVTNNNYQISDKIYKKQDNYNPKSIKRSDDLDSSD